MMCLGTLKGKITWFSRSKPLTGHTAGAENVGIGELKKGMPNFLIL